MSATEDWQIRIGSSRESDISGPQHGYLYDRGMGKENSGELSPGCLTKPIHLTFPAGRSSVGFILC